MSDSSGSGLGGLAFFLFILVVICRVLFLFSGALLLFGLAIFVFKIIADFATSKPSKKVEEKSSRRKKTSGDFYKWPETLYERAKNYDNREKKEKKAKNLEEKTLPLLDAGTMERREIATFGSREAEKERILKTIREPLDTSWQ